MFFFLCDYFFYMSFVIKNKSFRINIMPREIFILQAYFAYIYDKIVFFFLSYFVFYQVNSVMTALFCENLRKRVKLLKEDFHGPRALLVASNCVTKSLYTSTLRTQIFFLFSLHTQKSVNIKSTHALATKGTYFWDSKLAILELSNYPQSYAQLIHTRMCIFTYMYKK